ncbi:MarR family winged helix-turn-helix transcriptional regulator [Timonella sp. A28]|uniref:MarR family winged helix-turn-helix transcriptional regulator n=1 Tax=Timonella sp. A28 TaxID=3442640 RepID=UPI003EBFA799
MGEAVAGYWYSKPSSERELLQAVRRFGRADLGMRQRMAQDMDMGVTDMRALQIVIAAQRAGKPATAAFLARELSITTASTAKLLNRLTASGHVERKPNEHDKRSIIVVATELAHAEVKERLDGMHEHMSELVSSFSTQEQHAIARFLDGMTQIFEGAGEISPRAEG